MKPLNLYRHHQKLLQQAKQWIEGLTLERRSARSPWKGRAIKGADTTIRATVTKAGTKAGTERGGNATTVTYMNAGTRVILLAILCLLETYPPVKYLGLI